MEAYLLEFVSLRYWYLFIRFMLVDAFWRAGRTATKHPRWRIYFFTIVIIAEFRQLVVFDLFHRQCRQFFLRRSHYHFFIDRVRAECDDRGLAEALLPGSVPYLKLYTLSFDIHCLSLRLVDQQTDHTGFPLICIYVYACCNYSFSWLEVDWMSLVVVLAPICRHDREDLFFLSIVQLHQVQIDITIIFIFVGLELHNADLWLRWDRHLF